MPLLEGFTNIVMSNTPEENKNELLQMLLIVLAVKLVLIFLVAKYLWPRIMPALFSGVKANPDFLEILGLWFISGLILH